MTFRNVALSLSRALFIAADTSVSESHLGSERLLEPLFAFPLLPPNLYTDSLFVDAKVKGLVNRTHLRFPKADVRKVDLVEERHIDHRLLLELATGAYVRHRTNIVFHGMTGSGKSYLMCALAKESCHQQRRCLYMRIPNLVENWEESKKKAKGETKLLTKLTNYDVLCLDEWLFDPPEPGFRSFLFELIERRYDASPTLLCTQYPKKDWHQRLGGGVHADAIMDRIVHNAVWYYAGDVNMREHYGKDLGE